MSVGLSVREPTAIEPVAAQRLELMLAKSSASATPANWLGLFEATFALPALDDAHVADSLLPQHAEVIADVAMELAELGPKSLYLVSCGNCPLVPTAPHKESLLTVGVQDDIMTQIESNLAEGTVSAEAIAKRFQCKLPLFATWKRTHVVFGSHTLFDSAAAPAAKGEEGVALFLPAAGPQAATANPSPVSTPMTADAASEAFTASCAAPDATATASPHDKPRALLRRSSSVICRPASVPWSRYFQPHVVEFTRGHLNDTFFLLAVAAVSTNKLLFSTLFASLEHVEKGAAVFRFYSASSPDASPAPVLVPIDTLVPVANKHGATAGPKDMDIVFGKTTFARDAWLVLLEKAYATHKGSYAALHCGCAIEALVHLTGGTPHTAVWKPQGAAADEAPDLDTLWWLLQEATMHGHIMVAHTSPAAATLHSDSTADGGIVYSRSAAGQWPRHDVDWEEAIVVVFACEYDSTAEIPQDYYSKVLGKPTKRGEVHRLVKVRRCYRHRRDESMWSWDWKSSKWTSYAKSHLGRGGAESEDTSADSLTWWMTVEELARNYCALVTIHNPQAQCITTSLAHLTPAVSVDELAEAAPHYLLSVVRHATKATNALHRAASRKTVDDAPYQFRRLSEVQVPALDLGGDETDDDVPSSRSASPSAASANSPRQMSGSLNFLESLRGKSAAQLELRLSLPPSQRHKKFQMLLYRVQRQGKIDHPVSVVDGVAHRQLPVHGKMPWRALSAPIVLPPVNPLVPYSVDDVEDSRAFFAEVDLSEGFYNVVVLPDAAACASHAAVDTHGPLLLTVYHRNANSSNNGPHSATFSVEVAVL